MTDSISVIQAAALKMWDLKASEEALFSSLATLQANEVEELLQQYSHVLDDFRPVNLLRYEVLSLLRAGVPVDSKVYEDIKERIRHRDSDYFSKYGKQLVDTLHNYPEKKHDWFKVWTNPFRVLYVFFYAGAMKRGVEGALRDVETQLRDRLELRGFLSNTVSFEGPSNFGSAYCWMAFFPASKLNHQRSYQLFLQVNGGNLEAGLMPGSKLSKPEEKDVRAFDSFEEAATFLSSKKTRVLELNSGLRNYWKYAPGKRASRWEEVSREGLMAIGWDKLGDLAQYTSGQLADALDVEDPHESNELYILESFKEAAIGDVVIANRGKKEAVGVGVIEGPYEYRPDRQSFRHVRKVRWLVKKSVSVKKSFRPDTFSLTKEFQAVRKAYLERYPELAATFGELETAGPETLGPQRRSDDSNYWWLNANPKYWNILDHAVGQEQTYTAVNRDGNKRRIYEYFKAALPGDIVVGYQTSPEQKIVALFEITQSLHTSDEGEVISFKVTRLLKEPVSFGELKERPELEHCEVMQNHQGSLFKLTPQEYEVIQGIIADKNPTDWEVPVSAYDKNRALQDSNLPREEFERFLALVQLKKQVILQGPPGTGKTYLADIFRRFLTQDVRDRSEIVQFHPSYSYEDFVQGYRPIEGGGFTLRDGILRDICRRATVQRDTPFVLMIDEINRGNLSKVFGELLYLLEYRNQRIKLAYSPELDFGLPDNLYLIGTMNTADRSLALVDYALRRRFSFIRLSPNYSIMRKLLARGEGQVDTDKLVRNLEAVNKHISQVPSLGAGFEIGHSYFIRHLPLTMDSLRTTYQYELEPLLQEYFFDAPEQVDKLKALLFDGLPW